MIVIVSKTIDMIFISDTNINNDNTKNIIIIIMTIFMEIITLTKACIKNRKDLLPLLIFFIF